MKNKVIRLLSLISLTAITLSVNACSFIGDNQPEITKGNITADNTSVSGNTLPVVPIQTAASEIPAQSTVQAPKPVQLYDVLKDNVDRNGFDEKIAQIADKYYTVGLGLCVFANGKVVHQVNMGMADTEEQIPCGSETVYRAASVSKLISSMLLMTLYDQGKIDPYSDLEELTGLPYNSGGNKDRVLLWHLLTHTAGLTDSAAYFEAPKKYHDISYVFEKSNLGFNPGTKYLYTNFGLATVGAVIERLTNEYFHNYADEMIFSKLDMNAAYCADMLKNKDCCANIYNMGKLSVSPKNWKRYSGYYQSFGKGNSYLNANCELLITPYDLARLGIVIAGDGSVDGVNILSKDAVDLINTSYYSGDDIPFEMGLSTRIYNGNLIEGQRVFGHTGCAYGNVCGLFYDPVYHIGMALCTNGCTIGADENNQVFLIVEDCLKTVYDYFFNV